MRLLLSFTSSPPSPLLSSSPTLLSSPLLLSSSSRYGSSGDATHVTSAREDGAGAAQAMRAALWDAGVVGEEVWAVSAHATSTPLGDAAECAALRQVGQSNRVTSCSFVQ